MSLVSFHNRKVSKTGGLGELGKGVVPCCLEQVGNPCGPCSSLALSRVSVGDWHKALPLYVTLATLCDLGGRRPEWQTMERLP